MRSTIIRSSLSITWLLTAVTTQAQSLILPLNDKGRDVLADKETYVFIGRVLETSDIRISAELLTPWMKFEIIDECRSRSVGLKARINGEHRWSPNKYDRRTLFPANSPGQVALIVASRDKDELKLEERGLLPIGIRFPLHLTPSEVPDVAEAIKAWAALEDAKENKVDSEKLHKMYLSDNDFVACLAATAIAIRGTEDDRTELYYTFGRWDQSFLCTAWLDYLLTNLYPRSERVSLETRHERLVGYLRIKIEEKRREEFRAPKTVNATKADK